MNVGDPRYGNGCKGRKLRVATSPIQNGSQPLTTVEDAKGASDICPSLESNVQPNMEYQKVGRGGAGNFYSQEDIEKALKSTDVSRLRPCMFRTCSIDESQDVEAQRIATTPTTEDIEKSRSEYAHSGRGGAGNYTNATKLAEATAQTAGVTPSLVESKPPETGHYGRGGAGNYRSSDAEKAVDERRASGVQEKIHQQVVQDVESGLKEPEKAHLGGIKLDYDTLK